MCVCVCVYVPHLACACRCVRMCVCVCVQVLMLGPIGASGVQGAALETMEAMAKGSRSPSKAAAKAVEGRPGPAAGVARRRGGKEEEGEEEEEGMRLVAAAKEVGPIVVENANKVRGMGCMRGVAGWGGTCRHAQVRRPCCALSEGVALLCMPGAPGCGQGGANMQACTGAQPVLCCVKGAGSAVHASSTRVWAGGVNVQACAGEHADGHPSFEGGRVSRPLHTPAWPCLPALLLRTSQADRLVDHLARPTAVPAQANELQGMSRFERQQKQWNDYLTSIMRGSHVLQQ